jgi:hypothetical protein
MYKLFAYLVVFTYSPTYLPTYQPTNETYYFPTELGYQGETKD